MPRLATRTNDFLTFQVVELFKEAQALQAAGRDIISLGIGEPDFTAPPQVVEALERATRAGLNGYSAPAGLSALREAIAAFYESEFGARVDPAASSSPPAPRARWRWPAPRWSTRARKS